MLKVTDEVVDNFIVQVLYQCAEYNELEQDYLSMAKEVALQDFDDLDVPVKFMEAVTIREAIRYGMRLRNRQLRDQLHNLTTIDAQIMAAHNQHVNEIAEHVGCTTEYVKKILSFVITL